MKILPFQGQDQSPLGEGENETHCECRLVALTRLIKMLATMK